MAETLSIFNNVTRQIAREDILNNQCRESFKSYTVEFVNKGLVIKFVMTCKVCVVGPFSHPQSHPACDHFVTAQDDLGVSILCLAVKTNRLADSSSFQREYPSQPAYKRSLYYSRRFLSHPGPSPISQSELQPKVFYLNQPEPPLWHTSKSQGSVRLRKRN